MKTKLSVAALFAILAASVQSSAQTPLQHGFAGITALPDRTISLTLTGRVASTFRQYYDLYPIEVSSDLEAWKPLATLIRTNASTNALVYLDSERAQFSAKFYRTFTNHFITPTLRPTGPYAVGKFSLLLNDPSRTNRYNVRTNSSFMVSYWYPAEAKAGQLPGIWEDKPLAQDPNFWDSGYTDRVLRFVAHSLPSANISTDQPKYPMIIYVPGYSGTRAENQEKFEDLASHGYIVASADHWEVYGTVFPDGRYLHGSSVYAGETSAMLSNSNFAAKAFSRRMQDIRIMLSDLDRADAGDSILAGRVDTNNIGLMGYSFGGGVAAEMCRTNEQCRAIVVIDAGAQGADELLRVGLQKPFLGMYGTENGNTPDVSATSFFNKLTQDAFWILISKTVHSSFAYGYETTEPSAVNREAQVTMKAYLLSFFDKYLKGQDDHLLDGPSTNFPRIVYFQKK